MRRWIISIIELKWIFLVHCVWSQSLSFTSIRLIMTCSYHTTTPPFPFRRPHPPPLHCSCIRRWRHHRPLTPPPLTSPAHRCGVQHFDLRHHRGHRVLCPGEPNHWHIHWCIRAHSGIFTSCPNCPQADASSQPFKAQMTPTHWVLGSNGQCSCSFGGLPNLDLIYVYFQKVNEVPEWTCNGIVIFLLGCIFKIIWCW